MVWGRGGGGGDERWCGVEDNQKHEHFIEFDYNTQHKQ